eukprot:3356016-Rhodomonas_salina.1
MQEPAFSAQFVPGMRFLVSDFAVYRSPSTLCCALWLSSTEPAPNRRSMARTAQTGYTPGVAQVGAYCLRKCYATPGTELLVPGLVSKTEAAKAFHSALRRREREGERGDHVISLQGFEYALRVGPTLFLSSL